MFVANDATQEKIMKIDELMALPPAGLNPGTIVRERGEFESALVSVFGRSMATRVIHLACWRFIGVYGKDVSIAELGKYSHETNHRAGAATCDALRYMCGNMDLWPTLPTDVRSWQRESAIAHMSGRASRSNADSHAAWQALEARLADAGVSADIIEEVAKVRVLELIIRDEMHQCWMADAKALVRLRAETGRG